MKGGMFVKLNDPHTTQGYMGLNAVLVIVNGSKFQFMPISCVINFDKVFTGSRRAFAPLIVAKTRFYTTYNRLQASLTTSFNEMENA